MYSIVTTFTAVVFILHVLGDWAKTTRDTMKRHMQMTATANGMVEGDYVVENKILKMICQFLMIIVRIGCFSE
jgi:hypothetical protein